MITTRAREGGPKEHREKQKWPSETHSVTYLPGLSTLSDLSRIDAQPPPSFHCCPRPPSHHPSSLTSVSLVPSLNLLPPSKPFWPYGTHPFFHMPKPSQYSLICSTRKLRFYSSSPTHRFIPNYPFVTLQPNVSNTSSPEHSLSFSQHFSYPMPLLRTTPLEQLLLHRDTTWPFFPVLYCSAHFSALPTLYTLNSFCAPHPCHIIHQLPLAIPGTSNNPLSLMVCRSVSHAFDPHYYTSSTS